MNTELMTPGPSEILKTDEFNVNQSMMRAQQEVQGAIMVAKRFPRNEDEAAQALFRTCKRSAFAERAEYRFPRGKKKDEHGNWVENIISGPSANLAREAMRVWGNMAAGTEIVRDTPEERHIRSFAWDMQTNARKVAETTFRKLIQRKVNGKTEWVEPDERDLRELTNKHSAIAERNCIIQLIPSDIVDEARDLSRQTLRSEATRDPDAARRRLISGFDELNVTVGMLEAFLGHPLAQSSPKEITDLRAIWVSIRDGNSTWGEMMSAKVDENATFISPAQVAEFYAASKASGYNDEDRKAFTREKWSVDDSRKIPVEAFPEAIAWAKTKKPAKPAESPAASVSPIDEAAVRNRIGQLFEIHGTDKKTRENLIRDYAEDLPALATMLEANLPQDQ